MNALSRRSVDSCFSLLVLTAAAHGQGGFDYIGPDDALTTGNHLFVSQDRQNGESGVAAQPWTTSSSSLPREVWVVWGAGNQDLGQVSEWRVGMWSSQAALIASPDAGDLFSVSLAAPDLGDATTPIGMTATGRETFLIGFRITGVPLGGGVEVHFGVQAVQDPAINGVGGVVESAVVEASGVHVDSTVPGGWSLVSDLSESLHSGALAYRVVTDSADFTFCPGDGTAAGCPCGNTGATDHGCSNSAFASGCLMTVTGTASVSLDTLQLNAQLSRPLQPGLFFQGDNALNNGDGVPFGDGLRCAGGNVVRLEVATADAAGAVSTSVAIGVTGGASIGAVKRYQWWYRDPGASPCGFEFNLSNGVELTWVP